MFFFASFICIFDLSLYQPFSKPHARSYQINHCTMKQNNQPKKPLTQTHNQPPSQPPLKPSSQPSCNHPHDHPHNHPTTTPKTTLTTTLTTIPQPHCQYAGCCIPGWCLTSVYTLRTHLMPSNPSVPPSTFPSSPPLWPPIPQTRTLASISTCVLSTSRLSMTWYASMAGKTFITSTKLTKVGN